MTCHTADLQAYLAKKVVAGSTSFLARFLRPRVSFTGQKCLSRRGGGTRRGGSIARSHVREIAPSTRMFLHLPAIGPSRRPSESTQRGRVPLAMSRSQGTSFRIRATKSSWHRCHVTKICVSAAAPRASSSLAVAPTTTIVKRRQSADGPSAGCRRSSKLGSSRRHATATSNHVCSPAARPLPHGHVLT